ncbi:EthD family reductase [Pseudonocardia sp. N23]|uniref:EthD family reductase n=1 Tax=Pseudonocardia sp. N23 TaxID=1987376 RepID=UPI000BFCC6A5|nr:EthD family reductase [Pseudonocardia sp. N23]GAY08690.1 possible ethyl tert-butyl ether degradation protein [Pseudonocardia sp. N23]
MHRLTVCYGRPQDPAAFDAHYRDVHRPLAEKIPGLQSVRLGACEGIPAPDGTSTEAPYYLVAELEFADAATLAAALSSPEGAAAAGDLENFATGGVSLFVQRDLV